MDRLNLYFPFAIGERIGRLAVVRPGVEFQTIALPLRHASEGLRMLLSSTNPPIVKSRQGALVLLSFITEMLADAERRPKHKVDQKLIFYGDKIWDAFNVSLQMELPYLHAYCVSQTLAWDTDILVENASAMLPEEIQAKIPSEALTDWQQAGRCIAFDLYTASGFHTIRATEAVIRNYYVYIVGHLPGVKDRSWGAYTRVLKKHAGAAVSIIGLTDNIKDHHRNPLMHPEHRLTKDEAATLLSVCVGLIIQIVKGLP
jgi:hypothetical protein